jgi:hypothetical protein
MDRREWIVAMDRREWRAAIDRREIYLFLAIFTMLMCTLSL